MLRDHYYIRNVVDILDDQISTFLFFQVENIINCLSLLERIGVILDGITAKDVRDGNLKTILGLFFALSKYKQQQKQRQAAQAVQAAQTAIANERLHQKRQQHLAPLSEEMKQSRYVPLQSIMLIYRLLRPETDTVVVFAHTNCLLFADYRFV